MKRTARQAYRWLVLMVLVMWGASCLPVVPQAGASKQSAVLLVKPSSLEFQMEAGQSATDEESLAISTQGEGIYSWSVSDDVPWLVLEQSEKVGNANGNSVKVIVDARGMSAGIHTGIITVLAENIDNSPVYVPVHLVVSEADIEQPEVDGVKSAPATGTTSVDSSLPGQYPDSDSVVWANHTVFYKYSMVSSCLSRGSVSNINRWWTMKDIRLINADGDSIKIADSIPPGEIIVYSRYLPCYRLEDIKLHYEWIAP